jgi:tRNA (guanine9-N1)-methyltransferase
LKKAAKAERFAALKLERRAREKEAKKERKRQKAEKRAAGELDDEDEDESKRRAKKPRLQFGGTVVVDLGFDDMMNDKVSGIMYDNFPTFKLWKCSFPCTFHLGN